MPSSARSCRCEWDHCLHLPGSVIPPSFAHNCLLRAAFDASSKIENGPSKILRSSCPSGHRISTRIAFLRQELPSSVRICHCHNCLCELFPPKPTFESMQTAGSNYFSHAAKGVVLPAVRPCKFCASGLFAATKFFSSQTSPPSEFLGRNSDLEFCFSQTPPSPSFPLPFEPNRSLPMKGAGSGSREFAQPRSLAIHPEYSDQNFGDSAPSH